MHARGAQNALQYLSGTEQHEPRVTFRTGTTPQTYGCRLVYAANDSRKSTMEHAFPLAGGQTHGVASYNVAYRPRRQRQRTMHLRTWGKKTSGSHALSSGFGDQGEGLRPSAVTIKQT